MEPFGWKCPYCGREQAVVEERHEITETDIYNDDSELGPLRAAIRTTVCENTECKKLTLEFGIWKRKYINQGYTFSDQIQFWELLPESTAKPQPDYIPQAIRDNYVEACRIRDLSPKASATLSRRCLQGMIRDFWKVKNKPNLYQEIEAIKDKVDPVTWEAIDVVRTIDKVGAHMEKDVNVIIDVEPEEAQLLIGLIETLFQNWYISQHERKERMKGLIGLGEQKQKQIKATKQANNEPA